MREATISLKIRHAKHILLMLTLQVFIHGLQEPQEGTAAKINPIQEEHCGIICFLPIHQTYHTLTGYGSESHMLDIGIRQ